MGERNAVPQSRSAAAARGRPTKAASSALQEAADVGPLPDPLDRAQATAHGQGEALRPATAEAQRPLVFPAVASEVGATDEPVVADQPRRFRRPRGDGRESRQGSHSDSLQRARGEQSQVEAVLSDPRVPRPGVPRPRSPRTAAGTKGAQAPPESGRKSITGQENVGPGTGARRSGLVPASPNGENEPDLASHGWDAFPEAKALRESLQAK